jgi:hypothetical protein
MRAKFFAEDSRLKLYDDQGEFNSYDGVVELVFGSGRYYLEVPGADNEDADNDLSETGTLAATLEGEFYALANAPENPENTFNINQALTKFKALTPKVLVAGGNLVTDHDEIRKKWLADLKAMEKSIAKKVKAAIEADGDNACNWRGTTAGA